MADKVIKKDTAQETIIPEIIDTSVADTMTLEEMELKKKDRAARSIQYQRERDSKKVKGVFRYYEVPGGEMHFPYKAYKGDPVVKYSLKDNHTYELPLGVAKHLNNNCWYPVHRHEIDEKGKSKQRIGSKVNRTGFQSLQFMDDEDLNEHPDIYTPQKV